MAINNSTNLNVSNMTHYDGAGTYTGINLTDNALLQGQTSSTPRSSNIQMMKGQNCWFWNLSFTHSAGSLIIAGSDGSALSASNPAYVVMPSNATTGRLAQHKLTANITFTVSDLTGNIGNMTASQAYSNKFPLYIGFMADATDDNLVGVLTWVPNCDLSPSTSTNIGDPSAANADKTYSVFSFSDITESSYTSKSVGLIGSLTATKDSSDIYTLDALSAVYDGIGKWNDNRYFEVLGGTFGNGTGSFIKDNGGSAPAYSEMPLGYNIRPNGRILYTPAGGGTITKGTGAVDSIIGLPYESLDNGISYQYCGQGLISSGSFSRGLLTGYIDSASPQEALFFDKDSLTNVQNDEFNSTSGTEHFKFNYIARGRE